MVGAAIDYGYALNINQRLNEAADTAVLSAISPAIAQGAGTYALAYSGNHMKAQAQQVFTANTSSLPISVTPTVTITPSTSSTNVTTYTATLTYSSSVPTFFAGLVGLPSIPISGHAQATTTPLVYIRYYILIDISQSMGIAATASEMTALYNRIEQYGQGTGGEAGCVFGCHVAESTQNYASEDYAHYLSPRINLRIDSANTAVDSIIQTAIADENSASPNISIGLYTMSSYPSATITPIFPTPQTNPTVNKWQATTNLSAWQNVTIDLGPNTSGGLGDSDLATQITNFAANLPAQGTGASASSPLNYVFLVTDGVVDTVGSSCLYSHCVSALPSSTCNQLKAKATVGVIYTTYLPILSDPANPTNPNCSPYECNYYYFVYPLQNPTDTLTNNLTACATSSNYFFPASYGPDIVAAMQSLFTTSLQTVRLTQ
jgi:Flp pilus assembly protein TadG